MPRHKKPTDLEKSGRAVRQAAKVLKDRKWTKKTVGNPETGMCAIGAIRFAITGRTAGLASDDVKESLVNTACANFGLWLWESGLANSTSVPQWNDSPSTTKDEVIQFMEKFADEVDPQRP